MLFSSIKHDQNSSINRERFGNIFDWLRTTSKFAFPFICMRRRLISFRLCTMMWSITRHSHARVRWSSRRYHRFEPIGSRNFLNSWLSCRIKSRLCLTVFFCSSSHQLVRWRNSVSAIVLAQVNRWSKPPSVQDPLGILCLSPLLTTPPLWDFQVRALPVEATRSIRRALQWMMLKCGATETSRSEAALPMIWTNRKDCSSHPAAKLMPRTGILVWWASREMELVCFECN